MSSLGPVVLSLRPPAGIKSGAVRGAFDVRIQHVDLQELVSRTIADAFCIPTPGLPKGKRRYVKQRRWNKPRGLVENRVLSPPIACFDHNLFQRCSFAS